MKITDKSKKIIYISAIILAVIAMGLMTWLVGKPLVEFASEPDKFREWVNQDRLLGALGFMGMIFLQVVIAFIPGEPLELVAGYAFGAFDGTILCLLASTVAGMFVFLMVRRFGIKLIEVFFSKEKIESLRFLKSTPNRDFLLLIIFMIPGSPKDILTYFVGVTDISAWTWLAISSLGRLPSIITSTVSGSALGDQSYLLAGIVFGATALIAGAGLLVYNKIVKRHNETKSAQEKTDAGEKHENSNGNS